ncbi:hypothetical protein CSKR_110121, partial [Clonorchis sinensis]
RTTIERLRSTFPSTFNCPYDNHFEQNTARPRVACVYFTGLVRTSTYRSENSLSFLRHATKHPISDFAQELTTFTETRDCLLWRHTTFNTSVKCALKSFNQLSVFECPVTRITQYIETELLANGPTVQWRKGSDEKDIPLYNRPTDRLCDWVLGKLRLIWSNFCVKKIICSGRVEETTASVKLYSPSRIYGHLCPDMEDEGTREFALQQLNSPPEVSDRGSFKFIANSNKDIKVLYVKLTLSEEDRPKISSESKSENAKNEIIYQMDRLLGWGKLNESIIRRCFDGVTALNNVLQTAYFQIYLPEANEFQKDLLRNGLRFFRSFAFKILGVTEQSEEELFVRFNFTLPEDIEGKDAVVNDLVNAVLKRCTFSKNSVIEWTPVSSELIYEIRITLKFGDYLISSELIYEIRIKLTFGDDLIEDHDVECLMDAVQNELQASWISQIEIIGQQSENAQQA